MSGVSAISGVYFPILAQLKEADLTTEAGVLAVAKSEGGYKKLEDAAKARGLALVDLPDQKFNVVGWLKNQYSGYPVLLAAILKLIGNKKIQGVAPALININGTLTDGRSNPIKAGQVIDETELKYAIVVRWVEKGNSLPELANIDSDNKKAVAALFDKIIK